jgi:hypothetical protein
LGFGGFFFTWRNDRIFSIPNSSFTPSLVLK